MTQYVALLRGVNLGGKSKLPMAEFRNMLEELGYQNVRTYIQSGNAIFASGTGEEAMAQAIEASTAERFGIKSPVIIRTRKEFEELAAACPFDTAAIEPTKLQVMLLSGRPSPESIDRLDPERSPGDTFVIHNREIYLHLPNGSARSKLTVNYFDRMLDVTATGRNWNTIQKLLDMLAG